MSVLYISKPLPKKKQKNTSAHTHTQTHIALASVAITNRVQMTQQEVCVQTERRKPTGLTWKIAKGMSNTCGVYVCVCVFLYRVQSKDQESCFIRLEVGLSRLGSGT